MVHRSKKMTFSMIKEKANKKLSHWKRTFLSVSSREVLIKAIRTVISIFTFSCFKLPDSHLDELHRLMGNFWWGQKQNEKEDGMDWLGHSMQSKDGKGSRLQGSTSFQFNYTWEIMLEAS